jgi:tRNA(fMet)-specific endonuclease VapC
MLDTNILSYLMKKNHPHHEELLQRLTKEPEGSVAISVITVSEISEGIENIVEGKRKNQLFSALNYILSGLVTLEFNDESAWLYGKIRNNLRKIGQDIGAMDALIAAHAASQELILVTNNTKHFQRVSGLQIEDWVNTNNK